MHSIGTEVSGFLARNWQELAGFVTGALCVWLLIRQNIWNLPIGIANNIVYVIVFYKSGLFADSGLQFVYMAIAFYGWWNWLHGGVNHSELKVNRASARANRLYGDSSGHHWRAVLDPPAHAQQCPICRRADHGAFS